MSVPINIDIPKLILDNGGGLIKGGILPKYSDITDNLYDHIEPLFIIPNCVGQIRKKNIYHISENCYNLCEYFCHRPHKNGLLVDLEMQTKIWEKLFNTKNILKNKINEMCICITESYLTPSYIRQGLIELLFEYFNFEQIVIVSSQCMLPFSFLGLNLGQYDILNPPVDYLYSYEYSPSFNRSFKKNKSTHSNDDINLSINNFSDNFSFNLNDSPFNNSNNFDSMTNKSKRGRKAKDKNEKDNFENEKEIKRRGRKRKQKDDDIKKNNIYDSNFYTNKQVFIRNIDCYNKFTHKIYMEYKYQGNNWRECYFNKFFNINEKKHNFFSKNENNEYIINNIQSKYVGNKFLYQDYNFLLPMDIDIYKNYYENNITDVNIFKNYFNSNYINNYYSSIINGNNNLSLRNPCSLYIDVGFSHTYILPYIDYKLIEYAILRTKISASLLNDYFKNVISYKHINLEHNELLVENIKEKACYVSLDYLEDLKTEKNRLDYIKKKKIEEKLRKRELIQQNDQYNMQNYYLNQNIQYSTNMYDRDQDEEIKPHLYYDYKLIDYNNANKYELNQVYNTLRKDNTNACIHIESDYDYNHTFTNIEPYQNVQNLSSTLHLTNERISVPEILFNPKDINLNECSIVELIYRCVSLLPKHLQKFFVNQIYISGGTTKFKNFKHRLYKELRSIFPSNWDINIYFHNNSLYSNYIGTYIWLSDENIYKYNVITKEQYFNHGKIN